MNISNAIRNVERVFMNFPDIASDGDIESFEIAVEAMNKQDPMKPNARLYPDGSVESVCQNCKDAVEEGLFTYCPNCGQAIDWED